MLLLKSKAQAGVEGYKTMETSKHLRDKTVCNCRKAKQQLYTNTEIRPSFPSVSCNAGICTFHQEDFPLAWFEKLEMCDTTRRKEFNQGLVESWGTNSEFSQSCRFHRDTSVARSFALEIIQTQNSARKCVLHIYITMQQGHRLAKSSPKSQLLLVNAEPPVCALWHVAARHGPITQ